MSAQAEVGAGGPLRVKPPAPLSRARRLVIGIVAALVLVVGAVLVVQARSADGDAAPGAAWRKVPVPRAAKVDDFARAGALVGPDGFGRWQTGSDALQASGGILRSGDGEGIATIDAGTRDVLVHAQVVRMAPGSGLLVSSAPIGVPALVLRATGPHAWELSWVRSGPPPQVLRAFDAPTEAVSVQLIRRGDTIKVAFDGQAYDVDLPEGTSGGTFVGIDSEGPGNALDLFGYLPLAAG